MLFTKHNSVVVSVGISPPVMLLPSRPNRIALLISQQGATFTVFYAGDPSVGGAALGTLMTNDKSIRILACDYQQVLWQEIWMDTFFAGSNVIVTEVYY
jgi:hypothetical protein